MPTSLRRRAPAAALAPALAFALAACAAPAAPTGPALYEVHLAAPPLEGNQRPLLGAVPTFLTDALAALREVREDDRARGLFLRVGPLAGSWGRAHDLRAALLAIREAGKPVHCHFEVVDNTAYALVAPGCDRLTMTPAGSLELVGVAAQLFFLEPLLDRIGVEAELVQIGRFKGAADPFTESDLPEPVRENLGALLDDLQALLVEAVATGRKLAPAEVAALVDAGPYDGQGALAAKLVDGLAFADGAREAAREAAGVERVEVVELAPEPEEIGLGDLLRALAGEGEREEMQGRRIALVHLAGQIVDGEGEDFSAGMSSDPFVEAMKGLRDDDEVRAVVLRIDSPGGSALASDRMWHAVRLLAGKKPVIASIGDMAASGGYYVASAADEILADPGSIVGSIGVVGGKVVVEGLAEKLGVKTVVLARGAHAAWSSPLAPFTETERARFEEMLESTYRRFLARVATGRDVPVASLAPAAEGRIFAGTRAMELGLVDRLGTLGDALREARARGEVAEDAPIEVWPPERTLLDAIAQGLGGAEAAAPSGAVAHARALAEEAGLPAAELAGVVALLLEARPLAMTPFTLRVR